MRSVRPWTRKEEGQALEMYYQGVKQIVIAKRLGRPAAAVRKKLSRLRLANGVRATSRPWGDLMREVSRVHGPGISDLDMARVLDVDRTTVMLARRRLGLPPGVGGKVSRRGWRPGDPGGLRAAIVRLYGVWGRSDAEIAQLTGEPRFRVTYYREKMGIPACGRAGRPNKGNT